MPPKKSKEPVVEVIEEVKEEVKPEVKKKKILSQSQRDALERGRAIRLEKQKEKNDKII